MSASRLVIEAETLPNGPRPITIEFLEAAAGKPSRIARGVTGFPCEWNHETVLLGNGWLRRGDIATFISSAGAGKSVATAQAVMAWALGLPYLGLQPTRPLRIIHFCGEDDETTLGQIREGFLQHSEDLTGKQLDIEDLRPLCENLRTDFAREFIGANFHAHMKNLLTEEPADLIVVNPLLSFLGGEVVSEISQFLRGGVMPILQDFSCGCMITHHTTKLAKDGWDTLDDVYSGIGGGEVANIPRCVLTLRPTPADGISVVKAGKRVTTGWIDDEGKFTTSFFIRRTDDPTRPAWLPVDYGEAMAEIGEERPKGKSMAKVPLAAVIAHLKTGDVRQTSLVEKLIAECGCSDKTAKAAIRSAEDTGKIESYSEINPRGGHALKWLRLPKNQGEAS